ncbi:unnamed protein product, partial [marine sediment metagenome]
DGVIDVADLQILASAAMTKADWYHDPNQTE